MAFVHTGANSTSITATQDHFKTLAQYSRDPNPEYFFLGHSENSALVVMHRTSIKMAVYLEEIVANVQATGMYETESSTTPRKSQWPKADLKKLISASRPDADEIVKLDNDFTLPVLASFISAPGRHDDDVIDRLGAAIQILTDPDNAKIPLDWFFLEPLCRRLLSSVSSNSHLRACIYQLLAFLHFMGNGIDYDDRRVVFTKEDIGRFLALDMTDVESALEVFGPFIFKCDPPFLNPNSEEYLCLSSTSSRLRDSFVDFLGPQEWLRNASQFFCRYTPQISSSNCSFQPSGKYTYFSEIDSNLELITLECTCYKWEPELPGGKSIFGEGRIECDWASFWFALGRAIWDINSLSSADLEPFVDGLRKFPFCHLEDLHYKSSIVALNAFRSFLLSMVCSYFHVLWRGV